MHWRRSKNGTSNKDRVGMYEITHTAVYKAAVRVCLLAIVHSAVGTKWIGARAKFWMPLCPVTVIIISLYFLGVRKFGKNRLHFFKRRLFICDERTGVNHSASNRSYYASHSKLIWLKSYYICAHFEARFSTTDRAGLCNSFKFLFCLIFWSAS